MSIPDNKTRNFLSDEEHLRKLGYEGRFDRSMSLWGTFALGFTYLSPLVGVYSLFAFGVSLGGPPVIFWLVIVGCGQLLVALVFGEVVSQYPIAGGIYPWVRRLSGRYFAWMAAWIYIWAIIVTVTSVAEYGTGFLASLFGLPQTKEISLALAVALLLVALVINLSGTKNLARAAKIGLGAELIGVVGVGIYLMIFQRKNDFSVFFDTMGTAGDGSYLPVFIGAALTGLFLFYGFEACGEVAEEVANPGKEIPRAMIMTILVGGVSGLIAFAGYILAAPDLAAIVSGENADPIAGILEATLGTVGGKIFLVIALTAFLSCVLSLQAAGSRLLYSFGRDGMMPGHKWLAEVSAKKVPRNALIVACLVPILICLIIYFGPEGLINQVTAFAVLGIYVSFQSVVLASLLARFKGWKPAGQFSLGAWGLVVNIVALAYGITAMFLLAWPGTSGEFLSDWIVLIGLVLVVGTGLIYMAIVRPGRNLSLPEGDAVEIAEQLRNG
ncbi:APC family permease [Homoserinimonas sp. OAct 916]|uniref:APC family permease n=1 Tax=Homoserinimonas sp. OAct 916 TaxID=2211450 RepID=UPI000DBE1BAF|nr:amino acid permease [Homoserinimonas sp. OAct 916]